MMQQVSFQQYLQAMSPLKHAHGRLMTNLYLDAAQFSETLKLKPCLSLVSDTTVFILVPFHDMYYKLFYFVPNAQALDRNLALLQECYTGAMPLLAHVVGKENALNALWDVFNKNGYSLRRRSARMPSVIKYPEGTRTAKESLGGGNANSALLPEEATLEDVPEILVLLKEYFDVCSQDVPEADEIAHDIKNHVVVVARAEGRIIALHYSMVVNSIRNSRFDFVVKGHRRDISSTTLYLFALQCMRRKNMSITRSYGWRDLDNKRLMQHCRNLGQAPDGLFAYAMLREGGQHGQG